MCESVRENKEINIDWEKFKSNAKADNLIRTKQGYMEFCRMLNELDFELVSDYVSATDKVELKYKFSDNVKLNIKPITFKKQTYNNIINFKNELEQNGDSFIEFISLSESGNLIAKIKTFDGGEISIDIGAYCKFVKSRQNVYEYCEEKEYKILSPYIKDKDKILIDFNCGHEPHWIKPNGLKRHQGCPLCYESKGEKTIREYLEERDIKFKQEYVFADCRHKRKLPFDFYIPNYNLCIEFDGIQHFEVRNHFGGNKEFKNTQKRDKIKNNYCKENGIKLLRIPYYELDNVEDILNEEFEKLRKVS